MKQYRLLTPIIWRPNMINNRPIDRHLPIILILFATSPHRGLCVRLSTGNRVTASAIKDLTARAMFEKFAKIA